ncbi:MAG: hypothetical protein Q4D77_00015 [Peptostreptococcaceae bacterium]|nr:hypothetical protein [Peptostreptococcaceae bacterium]
MQIESMNHTQTHEKRKIAENILLLINALILIETWIRELSFLPEALEDLSWKLYDLYNAVGLDFLQRLEGRLYFLLLLLLYWVLRRKIARISGGEYKGMIRFLAHIILRKQSFWKKDKTGLFLVALNAYLIWYQFAQIWIALMGV